jgi:hypothetical protein
VVDARGALWAGLAGLIGDLARQTGGPAFAPHVTLQSRIDLPAPAVVAALAGMGRALARVELELVRPAETGEYFRAVFLEVALTGELAALRRRMEALFGQTPGAFEPHVSLVYGHVPEAQRREIAGDPRVLGLAGARCPARRLEVWRVSGPVSGWRSAGGVDLG